MKISGFSFSWKRALGVSGMKREPAKATGIPTTRSGLERKIGATIVNTIIVTTHHRQQEMTKHQNVFYLSTVG